LNSLSSFVNPIHSITFSYIEILILNSYLYVLICRYKDVVHEIVEHKNHGSPQVHELENQKQQHCDDPDDINEGVSKCYPGVENPVIGLLELDKDARQDEEYVEHI
jgi:hypothetical protein